ncbi:DNA alkylation repair protein [Magnetococcales bacterium HHB-1]
MSSAKEVKAALEKIGNPERADHSQRFFKTGPGEYGEGDLFIGVRVPEQRRIARRFRELPLSEIKILLSSPIHEHRLTALLILVDHYSRCQRNQQKGIIVDFYLANQKQVNNWDLVDLSSPKILGDYLLHQPDERKMLFTMAQSPNLWERRIAVLATAPLLRKGEFEELLSLSEMLLDDSHDLIQKAVGWMLREAGKVDIGFLKSFLEKHAALMPRTMLRYSIERLTAEQRKDYMGRKAKAIAK